MNRIIKFRGKCVDNGEWVYGLLSDINKECGYAQIDYYDKKYGCTGEIVDLSTVGQHTGLKDTNGTVIYEGDIIKITYNTHREIQNSCRYVVCFGEWVYSDDEYCDVLHNGWYLKRLDKTLPRICQPSEISLQDEVESNYIRIEIIGNIYDDKHLLEGGQCD